ncbi:MAG: hypothetical protein CSA18_04570 [Deltaproteobacteria bacterium]|nr:MAG: hypothetical protein CSA18_04570 [Deltaproteobacteria bacterium]
MMPETELEKTKFQIIWIIPLIATITAMWLIYKHYTEKKFPVIIEFKTGKGLVAGKTYIKYAGIKIGIIDKITLDTDKNIVLAKALLEKQYEPFAKEDSLFWLVKPRLEAGSVSDLETIVTGQYITVRPGKGKKSNHFKALDSPPPGNPDAPGLHLVLESETLGSLGHGSPVLYKKIKVGEVESHSLSKDGNNLKIQILIYPKYSNLVKKNTRFWNISGFTIKGDLSGIKIKSGTLTSIIDGGISFETPEFYKTKNQKAENNDKFTLYEDRESAMKKVFPIEVIFDNGEGLIAQKTPVKYRGITIGKVNELDVDRKTGNIIAKIFIIEKAKEITKENTKFWLVKPQFNLNGISGLGTILSGKYIEVQPGNGNTKTRFHALRSPPFSDNDSPGLHIVLKTDFLGDISQGSPVITKGIEVGKVEGYAVNKDMVHISIHIFDKYTNLIFENTRFWKKTGISVKGGLSGIKIETGSLQSMISGAIMFETPLKKGKKINNKKIFNLFHNKEKAFESDRKIIIAFNNVSGIKIDSTPVRYKGIEIGKITDIFYDKTNEKINATAILYKNAPVVEKKGSIFYLVNPILTTNKISGLETILTGPYINVLKGNGPFSKRFTASDSPPLMHPDFKGKIIKLQTDKPASLSKNVPVFYKGIKAGLIKDIKFIKKKNSFIAQAIIFSPYSELINNKTIFYNISGFDIKAGLSGIKIKTSSLNSILLGGIEFKTPDKKGKIIGDNYCFKLYENLEKAEKKGFYINLKTYDASGLKENHSKLVFKGVTIGRLDKINLINQNKEINLSVFVDKSARNLVNEGSVFLLKGFELDINGIKNADSIINGKYIELKTGNGKLKNNFILSSNKNYSSDNFLKIKLYSDSLGSLSRGKPVYYRQIKVGEVTGYELKNTFDKVIIHISIEKKYAPIIRKNSKFWYAGGIAANLNLLGLKIKTETMESILKGGISFATPDNKNMGPQADKGDSFKLFDKPKKKWLEWRPVLKNRTVDFGKQ